MGELTEKQRTVLKAIEEYIDENKFSPSVRELAEILGNKSLSVVHGYLIRLKEKGYICSNPTMPRTIRVLKNS